MICLHILDSGKTWKKDLKKEIRDNMFSDEMQMQNKNKDINKTKNKKENIYKWSVCRS